MNHIMLLQLLSPSTCGRLKSKPHRIHSYQMYGPGARPSSTEEAAAWRGSGRNISLEITEVSLRIAKVERQVAYQDKICDCSVFARTGQPPSRPAPG